MGVSKYKESAVNNYYHLYNRGNQKKLIFIDKDDYSYYLHRFRIAIKKLDFSLISYCLMPNHVHLIVKQNGIIPPSKLISSVHTSYAMIFNKKYKSVGHLFQDRFKQKIILDDDYMINLIAYILLNPVEGKICTDPKDYLWSSYREYVGLTKHPFCDQSLIKGYGFKRQSFKEFVMLARKINPYDAFDND